MTIQELFQASLDWSALAKIIWLDLLLSADNALVIGMVAHNLSPAQKRFAIVFGACFAVVTRIIVTFAVASALNLPGLHILASLLLFVVAVKLLLDEEKRKITENQSNHRHLFNAVVAIALADILMSFDNILAVAALSNGDIRLLVIGRAISIFIIMTCGTMLASFLDKYNWLTYLGAGFLAWISGRLLMEDKVIASWLDNHSWLDYLIPAIFVVLFGVTVKISRILIQVKAAQKATPRGTDMQRATSSVDDPVQIRMDSNTKEGQ